MLEKNSKDVNFSDEQGSNVSARASGDLSEVKKLYIFMNCFAISLGFMQFGIGMASFSNSQNAF